MIGGGCQMKLCCTFISKERRINPDQYDRYEKTKCQTSSMTLWKNDEENSAAALIADQGIKKATLLASDVTDENGNPTTEITIKAEFQKFIPTYNGSNWIPEPRPFQPPKPPEDNRVFSADVIWGSEIEESLMIETNGKRIQPFWITVSSSKNARPGIYTGKIYVQSESCEQTELVLNIRILDLELDDGGDYYLNLWQYPYASAMYYGIRSFSKEHLTIIKNQLKPYIRAGGKTGTASIVEEPWYHQTWCDYPSSALNAGNGENKKSSQAFTVCLEIIRELFP